MKTEKPPEHVKLGKAKATEVVILQDGTRLAKKSMVRYWLQRQGARLTYFLFYNDHIYRLTGVEFTRRFKIIIKGGEIKLPPPTEDQG